MRCGIGYDIHPFAAGRKLVLGGVTVPYKRGLAGHSDADVLVHSLADALLGACGERDLGYHFPDSDKKYRGICSLSLLEKVRDMLKEKGFVILNSDSTIIAQQPFLSPYIPQMKENIARVLKIEQEKIGIKAKSPEGVGSLGREEAIACISVVCIEEKNGT